MKLLIYPSEASNRKMIGLLRFIFALQRLNDNVYRKGEPQFVFKFHAPRGEIRCMSGESFIKYYFYYL
jgi:hypothetical protein